MAVKYLSGAPKEASDDDGRTSCGVPAPYGHRVVRPSPERLRVRASLERSLETSDPRLLPPRSALLRVCSFTLCRHPLVGVLRSARQPEPLRPALAVDQQCRLKQDSPGQMLYGSNADDRRRLRSFTAQNERPRPDIKQPLPARRSLEHEAEVRTPARPWAGESKPLRDVNPGPHSAQ